MSHVNPFDVFARLDPAIWLLTAEANSRRGGLIATFVNQASLKRQMQRDQEIDSAAIEQWRQQQKG